MFTGCRTIWLLFLLHILHTHMYPHTRKSTAMSTGELLVKRCGERKLTKTDSRLAVAKIHSCFFSCADCCTSLCSHFGMPGIKWRYWRKIETRWSLKYFGKKSKVQKIHWNGGEMTCLIKNVIERKDDAGGQAKSVWSYGGSLA